MRAKFNLSLIMNFLIVGIAVAGAQHFVEWGCWVVGRQATGDAADSGRSGMVIQRR